MNTEFRALDDAELEQVAGGWKECPNGTYAGGGPGLYPDYANCAASWGDLVQIIVKTAEKGKQIQQQSGGGGGGRPA